MTMHGLLERPLHAAEMYVRWLVMSHRSCGVWSHHSKAVGCAWGTVLWRPAQFCWRLALCSRAGRHLYHVSSLSIQLVEL